jgi:hypothetical protein
MALLLLSAATVGSLVGRSGGSDVCDQRRGQQGECDSLQRDAYAMTLFQRR